MKNSKNNKVKLDDKDTSNVSAGLLDSLRRLGEKLGISKKKTSSNEKSPRNCVAYGALALFPIKTRRKLSNAEQHVKKVYRKDRELRWQL